MELKSYPSGLVDLMSDKEALDAGLDRHIVFELAQLDMPINATLSDWRTRFYQLQADKRKSSDFDRPKAKSPAELILILNGHNQELERKLSICVEALQRIASNDANASPSAIALTALERLISLGEQVNNAKA